MPRYREFFCERTRKDGEIVIQGQFWELSEDGSRPPRVDLCLKKEVEYIRRGSRPIERSEEEQENFLTKLYSEKLELLKKESKQEKRDRHRAQMVSYLMKEWLEYVETKGSPQTRKIYVTTVNYYLTSVGDHPVNEYDYKKYITFLKFLKAKTNRMGGNLSDSKIRSHFRQLRAFYNWCFKHRILDRPFYVELPPETKKEQRPYRSEELKILAETILKSIDAAERKNHRICRINDFRALIMFSYTGMRRGAVWALELKNIDLDQGIIKIRRNEELNWNNKKLKERNKPISSTLMKFLVRDLAEREPQERYYLDSGKGSPCYLDPRGLTKAFERHRNDAGFPKEIKPIKAIRNHGVNMLLSKGVGMKVAQQFFDHESIITTDGYTNHVIFKDQIQEAAELVKIGWEDELFK